LGSGGKNAAFMPDWTRHFEPLSYESNMLYILLVLGFPVFLIDVSKSPVCPQVELIHLQSHFPLVLEKFKPVAVSSFDASLNIRSS
jgi:hypothetical protein